MQVRKNGRVAMVAAAVVGGLMSRYAVGAAQTWDGGAADHNWNNAVNWTNDATPAGGNATINSVDPASYPIISANSAFTPVDMFVGTGAGNAGRLDQTAGTASTGNGNWMFVGVNGSSSGSFFNVANTAATGGTTTTFGQGTGSFTSGRLYVGGADFNGNGTGTLNVNTSGTITTTTGGGVSFSIGHDGTGTMNLDNGTLNGAGEFWVGAAGGANGTVNMSAGTINSASWFVIGRSGTGTVNISGGTINGATGGGNMTMGSFTGATGTLNASGSGIVTTPNQLFVGEGAAATVNVSGNALVSPVGGLKLGVNTGATGTVNLNGGTILTPSVTQGSGAGTFNFNGGTLKASAASGAFVTGISTANVGNGGAVIDSNGFAVTIGQNLLNNGTGGLTKNSAGALTLTGASTYAGNTTINGGSLILSGAGSVNSSSGVTVNNGAKFITTSSAAVSPAVHIVSGGVDGTGTINTLNVDSSPTNTIANGNGGTGALTVGALNLSGAAAFSLNVASTSPAIAATTLNTSGAANAVVNAANALWTPGTYDLISYGTLGGSGFGAFTKGTITGLSGRQSATLGNDTAGNFITLAIAGDNPRWSGALSNEWSTNTLANPKNWALITGGTPTDYIQGDVVLFDDNATTTSPTISIANVSPTSVQFNNATKAYTLGGAFGITGSTGLIKNGAAALTVNNSNSYTGNTTLNAGTLNINNASAIGTGTLIINGGTIDNTSGSAVALSSNNPQNWNGDFTFTGSNDLNMGTAPVTMSASRTVTVSGGTFTVGAIAGPNDSLTKAGAGTLVVGGTSAYSGNTTVSGGTLAVNGSIVSTTSTNIDGGAITVSGTLAAPIHNLYNGSMTVNTGGTVNATNGGDTWVGRNGTASLIVNTGGTFNGNTVLIGGYNNTGGTGTATVAGTLNTANWLVVGFANGGIGTLNVNGGTVNIRNNNTFGNLEIGTWDNGTTGTVNMNSGSLNLLNGSAIVMSVMGNHTGDTTFNQNGGNVTFYSDNGTT
ncbi:MAG TPA: autotransporter-associated beta strand repeat-containing protein, partial [Tepidisphaeraceae bacterium]|nr:autotransporter-associated beta strand repeat-containing protein [Tepidisphaeraceae bacterium]